MSGNPKTTIVRNMSHQTDVQYPACTCFQIDDTLVLEARRRDNLKLKMRDPTRDVAVIYFSSHSIYFPNDAATFMREILEMDRYEWTNPFNDFPGAGMNIYVRDLFKQWYIDGISTQICSVEQMASLLLDQIGNRRLITVGSSAGGYAAALFGILLNAQVVYCFSGQFDLERDALYPGGIKTH